MGHRCRLDTNPCHRLDSRHTSFPDKSQHWCRSIDAIVHKSWKRESALLHARCRDKTTKRSTYFQWRAHRLLAVFWAVNVSLDSKHPNQLPNRIYPGSPRSFPADKSGLWKKNEIQRISKANLLALIGAHGANDRMRPEPGHYLYAAYNAQDAPA